ncbi:ADP-ribosylation factor 1 [Botrytis cinerea]
MLSILRKARLKDKEMRILMLGLDNAGKTTIVKRIMGEDVNTVSPTLGFIIKTIEHSGKMHTEPYNRRDVGGQKTLRSYWRNYFEKTDALIWVVDATDRLRIEDCKEELHALLQEEMLVLDEIRTHKWHIINCSAITGENLDEGLTWVVEDSKERLFLY